LSEVSTFDEHLLRELAPQVLGSIVRRFRDFAAAEDAVQEALIAAATQWPSQGVPDNPRGWLIHVASRRLTDQIRSDSARRKREETSVQDLSLAAGFVQANAAAARTGDFPPEDDDSLLLLFMCCHPALTDSSAIALTLRAVGGLATAEIASAFLVPEATMAQRISRAKQTVKSSGKPFAMPAGEAERSERLRPVLHVLYLIFNEGYTSSGGADLQRVELADEAIRLARMVRRLLPQDAEVAGLLALMLLTDARKRARTGPAGELIPLTRQDRTLWDQRQIAEGVSLVSEALSRGSVGAYQLQAAVAALHDEAARVEDTDWPQIAALYSILKRISPDNPMVALNLAIATAMVQGPEAGLNQLDELSASDVRLREHHRMSAARAHLLELAGRPDAAVTHYLEAANRTASVPERNYLLTQAARLRENK
jgi:RNA polymerase sigma factor (sigma-70 family)